MVSQPKSQFSHLLEPNLNTKSQIFAGNAKSKAFGSSQSAAKTQAIDIFSGNAKSKAFGSSQSAAKTQAIHDYPSTNGK